MRSINRQRQQKYLTKDTSVSFAHAFQNTEQNTAFHYPVTNNGIPYLITDRHYFQPIKRTPSCQQCQNKDAFISDRHYSSVP